jgi:ferredoxin
VGMGPPEDLSVWVDQQLCTGDGLCVQYAPEVFEFDIDGLAYVKAGEELLTAPGSRTQVPAHLRLEVIDAARDCPGECIHVCGADARGTAPGGGAGSPPGPNGRPAAPPTPG